MNILEIENLQLHLDGKPILKGVTLGLWGGHVHAVVGPNGAGKSTLASVIMGLPGYRDVAGDIRFEGRSIASLTPDARARLGITLGWQEPARFEGLKVRDYLRVSAHNAGRAGGAELLARVGMDPETYLDRAVDKTLSGGERKKLELAAILAMRPKLALLDEPDSGIDVESLERIFEAIRDLKASGATVVLITHSLAVLRQAEHAFLMCAGQIVRKGAIADLAEYFERQCMGCEDRDPARKEARS